MIDSVAQIGRQTILMYRGTISRFEVFGTAGVFLAILLGLCLSFERGLPIIPCVGVAIFLICFFTLSMLTVKIVSGNVTLVFYRYSLLMLVAETMTLRLLYLPVLPLLDITVVAIGLFLGFGRVGCFSVGCCHGRPCRWGVCYGSEQVRTGFPSWLAGVRLFPVQALEALWVLCLALVGTIWLLHGPVSGSVFAFYTVAYGSGRFFIEFLRGDEGRPHLFGFSEAQWTSVVLVGGMVLAESWHLLPKQFFPLPVFKFLLTSLFIIAFLRAMRRSTSHAFFSAKHINEVARALIFLQAPAITSMDVFGAPGATPIQVVCTSEGLKISLGRIRRFNRSLVHFSLSSERSPLSAKDAKSLARIIGYLCGSAVSFRVVAGASGVFHAVGG